MKAITLHQIEVTSECNLRCVYCLHPVMTRPKVHLTAAHFQRALVWLDYYLEQGTQGEVVMFGTGEPFLHPDFVDMCAAVRAKIGPSRRILTTTNGIPVTEAHVAGLKPLNVRCYVSMHRPERATKAVHWLHDAGLLEGTVCDAVTGSNSWGGQVNWPDLPCPGGKPVCPWTRKAQVFVGADGVLYPCCYANGNTPHLAHVEDTPGPLWVSGWSACEKCWQVPYDQPTDPPATRMTR